MIRVIDQFEVRPVVAVPRDDSPGAKQEFKDECDINRIMKRVLKGQVPALAAGAPQYGDFAGVEDFHTAQNVLLTATAQFARLPSEIRKRFGNSPVAMLEFVHNEKNREEAVKLGLVKAPEKEPGPMKVEVVNAVPPGDKKP